MANSGTPFNRAFLFVAYAHLQERPEPLEGLERHSMVACSGKGFALCCVPLVAVFEPVARYRPQASKLQAVTSLKFLLMGLIAMIYQFLGVSRQHYDRTKAEQIRIQADNEQQARAYLARNYVLVLLGRLPNSAKNDRTLVINGGFMRKNNHFQAVFKNAPDLAYQVTAGIEHLKCVPVLLTGLYCLSQTYKGEHIKDDIIESLESFAEMQKYSLINYLKTRVCFMTLLMN